MVYLRRVNAVSRKGSASRLLDIDATLRKNYGNVVVGATPLGNKRNPLDELVFIQLSVRTPEREYEVTYRAFRRFVRGCWGRLLTADENAAVVVLRRGGMARVKVRRLMQTFAMLREQFGRVTLAPLRYMSDDEAETALLNLPGVGKKVARCVLLYSFDRNVFPVDTHCFRMLERLGLTTRDRTYRQSHDDLQARIPPPIRRSLHVNLVRHGRAVCTPHQPNCPDCVLLPFCPTGRQRMSRRITWHASGSVDSLIDSKAKNGADLTGSASRA